MNCLKLLKTWVGLVLHFGLKGAYLCIWLEVDLLNMLNYAVMGQNYNSNFSFTIQGHL